MKKINIFILLLLFSFISNAQYIHESIDITDSDRGVGIVKADDNFFLLSISICSNGARCIGLAKTDLEGEVIWTKGIDSLAIDGLNSMVYANESIYLITYDVLNPDRNTIIILRLNNDGELTGHWEVAQSLDEVKINSLIKTVEGFLLNLRYEHPSGNRRGWLGFYDEGFNLLNEMDYGVEHNRVGGLGEVIIDNEGNILVANYQIDEFAREQGLVRKLDTNGDLLWEKELVMSESGESLPTIIALDNNTYAVTWEIDGWGVNNFPPAIYGIDTDGNTLWQHVFYGELGRKGLFNTFKTENGDIVGIGLDFDLEGEFPDDAGRSGWVFRMTANGELLWERIIADYTLLEIIPYFGQELVSGVELENGDLAFLGTIQDTFPNGIPFINNSNLWLLRTDSEGCLVSNCSDVQIINGESITNYTATEDIKRNPSDEKHFLLYPNPVNDKLTVSLKQDENVILEQVNMEVRDVFGCVVIKKANRILPYDIDVSRLQQGIYFVHIENRYILKFMKI